jgi:hypothetical protein
MARCIYCGSDQVAGQRRRLYCVVCGQEQPRAKRRKLRARRDLDELIKSRVGDGHDYEPSGYGQMSRVCGLAQWVHHPGFTPRVE